MNNNFHAYMKNNDNNNILVGNSLLYYMCNFFLENLIR